ncbi:MAG: hypothetical protein PHS04_12915 [Tissierellia bacterium]|nr:hypothetical protein [Tissierellia bacterium]
MNFSECNPIILLSVAGIIIIGLALVASHQDGLLLKGIIAFLAGTAGLMAEVPGILKGKDKK